MYRPHLLFFFPKLHLTKICTCARNGSRQVDRVVGLSLNWHSSVGDKQEKKTSVEIGVSFKKNEERAFKRGDS